MPARARGAGNVNVHIVKRKGHLERFDERKVYASCYEACLSAQIPNSTAEHICGLASDDVKKWVLTQRQVNSHQIFLRVAEFLRKHHKDVAFMYETHRDVS
ncbi:MAG: hypothetical protein HY393_03830 [Candidatus Diapherotrites archaeon]|nr:hypothetical protein [Candidatus Diapherotrites archaeon]